MNYSEFTKGNTIFVCVDPAAVNIVHSIVMILKSEGWSNEDFIIFTNEFGIIHPELEQITQVVKFDSTTITTALESIKPKLVFLGTSIGNHEWLWIDTCSKANIKTMSYIDYWSNYRNRFLHDNSLVLPTEILVPNEKGREEGVEEGLPIERLKVFRNPYFSLVERFVSAVPKKEMLGSVGILDDRPILVFVSDDIKSNNLSLGFDEYSVFTGFLEAMTFIQKKESHPVPYNLIVKLHPRAKQGKFKDLINKHQSPLLNIIENQSLDSKTLNYHADYIIGMFSTMMIEALLLKKKVLRVELDQQKELFQFDEIPCDLVTKKSELNEKLKHFLALS